jgi:predicted transcriptional regulator
VATEVVVQGFGDLEAKIMGLLWDADGPKTVREVRDDLAAERELAYTTVMTVMDNLHRKGWLSRAPVGRAYAYRPKVTRERYTANLMSEALAASADRTATLLAFVEGLGPDEAAHLRSVLDSSTQPLPAHPRRTRGS